MAYEQMKNYRSRMTTKADKSEVSDTPNTTTNNNNNNSTATQTQSNLGNIDFFVTSSLSKVFAGCVTYPYQVLRSRLQTYDAHLVYRGAGDAIAQIWAREGVAGFYKGLGPNLFRVLPSTWVTFLVYENTKAVLPGIAMSLVGKS